MRKLVSLAIVLVCVGTAIPGQADDARAIVDKAIQAAGGEAVIAKQKSMTWKEKGTYYGMGDGLPYTSFCAIQWPMQFRLQVEGVFTMVLDGDKGWTESGGQVKEMTKEELALQQHNQRAGWVTSLIPLKDKAFTLKSLGEAKVGEHLAHVVSVTRADYPEVKLYVDKKSNLLVKTEFKTKSPEQNFKEITQTMYMSDFRDFEGGKYPYKVAIKQDGKLFVEAEISDLKLPGKIDAKLFARPGQ